MIEIWYSVKTQGQDFKIYGSNMKFLSQVTCIWNTKALSLIIQKDMAKVKVFKKWVKLQGQGHMAKNYGTLESSCHKKHTYEI